MSAPEDRIAPLRDFVVAMTRLVEAGADEATLVVEGRRLLAQLVARDDWLPEAFTRPDPQFYRQYLLHADPLERFSVVSFVWGPGQHTPIHDHTVWGLIGMLRGAERCQRYRSADDGRLVPHGGEEILHPGEVDAVSPTTGDVHVYGGNIGAVRRHVFDPQAGEAKDFVSGYSSEVVPNLWDRSAVVRAGIGGG